MKIISNFKDYYDFMVGKYGADPKVVYERVCQEYSGIDKSWSKQGMYTPEYLKFGKDRSEKWQVHFCGKEYYIYYVYGDWFFGEEIVNIVPEKYPQYSATTAFFNGAHNDQRSMLKSWRAEFDTPKSFFSKSPKVQGMASDVNEKLKCPVVIGDSIKNPRLKDIEFGKIIPPEEAFITISNWLSREKVIVDRRNDKEKILSHGFDTKTSFRNM